MTSPKQAAQKSIFERPHPAGMDLPLSKPRYDKDIPSANYQDLANLYALNGDIENLIRLGETHMFSVKLDMTPEMAEKLLEKNSGNRPLRLNGLSRSVASYALSMKNGEWKLNGEGILIASDGYVNDGQHRLFGVCRSGVASVPMWVTFGVERDSRNTVDQGAARSPGNILAMHGEKNVNALAHAVKMLWCYYNDRSFSDPIPPDLLPAMVNKYPDARECVTETGVFTKAFRLSPGAVSFAYYICAAVNPNVAREFLSAVTTGLDIKDASSPVAKLRSRVFEPLQKKKKGKLDSVEQAALFVKAFNAYSKGKTTLKSLTWDPSTEKFPYPIKKINGAD